MRPLELLVRLRSTHDLRSWQAACHSREGLATLELKKQDARYHESDGQCSEPRHRLSQEQEAYDQNERRRRTADDERRGDAQAVLVREEAEGVDASRGDPRQGEEPDGVGTQGDLVPARPHHEDRKST